MGVMSGGLGDNLSAVCRRCGYRAATLSVSACPSCGGTVVVDRASAARARVGWFDLPPMLHQAQYVWFVFLSALDVVVTWMILRLDGVELNALADAVIQHRGAWGLIGYKFALVLFVIINCDVIGRRRAHLGFKLSEWAVALSAIPVIVGLLQLGVFTWWPERLA